MPRLSRLLALAAIPILAWQGTARAGVVTASDTAFVVSGTTDIAATPAAVWRRLVQPATWWDKAHSWSGDAANLSLDPRPGGCFCERLTGGGGVVHMRVIYAQPSALLRMSGALGPLQGEPASGVLTVSLTGQGASTRLAWSYKVSGLVEMKGGGIASAVDGVLGAQFARLAEVAAHGGQGSAKAF